MKNRQPFGRRFLIFMADQHHHIQRLVNGTPKQHNITLLEHERMERRLMKNGMSQDEAHEIASKTYNYRKESQEYYDSLNKHRKKK